MASRLLDEVGLAPASRVELLRRRAEKAERATAKAEGMAARAEADAAAADRRAAAALETMRERLPGVGRTIGQAQEQSMAIEVKLKILEGAITVLDERFRTLAAGPSPAAWWGENGDGLSRAELAGQPPEAADGTR